MRSLFASTDVLRNIIAEGDEVARLERSLNSKYGAT